MTLPLSGLTFPFVVRCPPELREVPRRRAQEVTASAALPAAPGPPS